MDIRDKILHGLMAIGWNYLPEYLHGKSLDEILEAFGY